MEPLFFESGLFVFFIITYCRIRGSFVIKTEVALILSFRGVHSICKRCRVPVRDSDVSQRCSVSVRDAEFLSEILM